MIDKKKVIYVSFIFLGLVACVIGLFNMGLILVGAIYYDIPVNIFNLFVNLIIVILGIISMIELKRRYEE